MADENPLLKAYPKAPPSCSTRQYCIAGLQTTIYGLDELLSTTKSAGVACIWLLHGRMGKQDMMQPVAASVLHAWNQYQMAQPDRQDYVGLVAVTFDQRNHGSREIDAKRNQDWRSGNMTHAIDMFSIYQGTTSDLSQMMDYIQPYLFTGTSHRIACHLVCGISLGGHAAWQSILRESRVKAGISIIGCPDYAHLMLDRAQLSKLDIDSDESFFDSRYFPTALLDAIDTHDPAGTITRGVYDLSSVRNFPERFRNPEAQSHMEARLRQTVQGKAFLNLSGADDKLVPYRCSEGFVDWLSDTVTTRGFAANFIFQNKVFEGVGHALSPDMAKEVDRFVVAFLSGSQAALGFKNSRI